MRKKFLKKVVALLVATVTTCVAFTGCSGQKNPSNGGASNANGAARTAVEVTGPITITLWHCSGSGANYEYLKALVKAFNETNEYGITVETMFVAGYAEMVSKVSTSIAGNESPELAVFADAGIPIMASKGVFADMTAYVEKDNFNMENFLKPLHSYCKYEDQIISFPFNRSTSVLYYNTDIWSAAGMTPSADITELYKQAEAITKANPGVYGFGAHSDPFYFQEAWVRSLGSEGLTTDGGNKPCALDDGNLEKVYTNWLAGIEAGYMPTPAVTDAETKMRELFCRGELASFVGSSGGMTNIIESAKALGVNVGVSLMPSYNGSSSVCGGANLAVIGKNKTDQQVAAAWEFIKFFSSDEWVAERAIATGFIPVTYSAAESERMKAYWAEHPEYQVAYDQAEYSECASWSVYQNEWNTYLNTATSYVLQDKSMTPKEAVEYLKKQAMIIFE